MARRGDPLWNGALIGAAAVGILAVSAQGDSYCAELDRLYGQGTCSRSGDPTAGVIVGAAIGGAIGAFYLFSFNFRSALFQRPARVCVFDAGGWSRLRA